MRILEQESSRWTKEFIEFEQKLKEDFSEVIVTTLFDEEGTIRHMKQMTYREGKEIQSITIRATFLIDTGNLFKETIGFDVYTDECIDFISVRIGYGQNYKLFKKNDITLVTNFIIDNINSLKYQLKNDKSNKNRNIKYFY